MSEWGTRYSNTPISPKGGDISAVHVIRKKELSHDFNAFNSNMSGVSIIHNVHESIEIFLFFLTSLLKYVSKNF